MLMYACLISCCFLACVVSLGTKARECKFCAGIVYELLDPMPKEGLLLPGLTLHFHHALRLAFVQKIKF